MRTQRLLMVTILAGLLVFSLASLACGRQMGMMGRMSGRQMMDMMQDPEMMDEWMDELGRNPEMMGRMMVQMHQRFRERRDGPVPLFCPMMGFTPENPPAPEPDYEPGTLSAAELFERKCSRCHALPDPGLHSAAEWEGTIERMSGYIDAVGFVSASSEELDAILSYLQQGARSE